jgi:hypothetical protein
MKYIVIPTNKYTGDLDVRGPYADEEARDDAAQLYLFNDMTAPKLYFLDVDAAGKPYTWPPSAAYINDLRQRWESKE